MLDLTIIIPVYNEEEILEKSIKKLLKEARKLGMSFEIIIADNFSKDNTAKIAKRLERQIKEVMYHYIGVKGRGAALRDTIKNKARGRIILYMDADLVTDLKHMPEIIGKINEGYDFATGSRLMKGSEIVGRILVREILSRGYNFLCRLLFNDKIKDHQCGFKAFKRDKVLEILDEVKDNHWTFDTEILVRGKRKGYSIAEVPVKWHEDDKKSKVELKEEIFDHFFKNLVKLYIDLRKGE
jgi:glycosyltransferase involved in cell wall biosynthesis